MISMLPQLLDDMSVDTSFTVERFVRESAQGRIETVKKMIPKMKDRVSLHCILAKTSELNQMPKLHLFRFSMIMKIYCVIILNSN